MKQKSKKLIVLIIISLVMILGFATLANAADDEFKISNDKEDVVLNGTCSLYCENKPVGETVTWSSSNESIASVDSTGKVTGKKIGTATITATVGEKNATCTINVVYNSSAIPSNYNVYLAIGEKDSETISITAKDYKSNEITNPEVQWKSNDESIAKVDSNGKITAVKEGTTKVIASIPGATAEIKVNVEKPTFTDFSNAIFSVDANSYNSANINVDINKVNLIDNHVYYLYISKKSSEKEFSKDKLHLLSKEKDKNILYTNILNEDASLLLEQTGDTYVYIIESQMVRNFNKFEKAVLSGKKLEVTKELRPIGSRLDLWLFDFDKTYISNKINISKDRSITYKIGKVSSTDVLKAFKNKGESEGFAKLYSFAKADKGLKTGNLKLDKQELNYNLINDVNINNNEYYYIYMVADTNNGKYKELEEVQIYQGNYTNIKEKAMVHFAFGDMNIPVEIKETETKTTENKKPKSLPKTGSVAIGLVIVAMVGIAVFFKVKNNEYKGL